MAAHQQADEAVAVALAVNDFLQHDLLGEAAPDKNDRDKKVTVEEVLGRAAARIPGKFEQQPLVEAAIRNAIGQAYRALGDYTAAQPHLERALEVNRRVLGEEHQNTLDSMDRLAALYVFQHELAKAEPLIAKAVETQRRVLAEEHPNTLTSMDVLASVYKGQGQLAKAEQLWVSAIESSRRVLGEEDPRTAGLIANLAALYLDQGDFAKAEPLSIQAVQVFHRTKGNEHPYTLRATQILAQLYQAQGQFAKAETLDKQLLEIRGRVLGPDHPDTRQSMNNLASTYILANEFEKAVALLEQALPTSRTKLGPEHPDTLAMMCNLANAYTHVGQLDQALALGEQTLELSRKVLGPEHPRTLTAMNVVAGVNWQMHKLDRSIPLFEEIVRLRENTLPADHPETLRDKANLGVNYRDAGRLVEGLALLEEAFLKGRAQPALFLFENDLLEMYIQAGKTTEAANLAKETIGELRAKLPPDSLELGGALAAKALIFLKLKAWDEAEPILRESLAIRQRQQPDAWTTFNTQSMLGGALAGQQKYAEAEPLLLQGYEGLAQRAEQIPEPGKVRLPQALERLVQFYEATGKPDEATRWRQELVTHQSPERPPAAVK